MAGWCQQLYEMLSSYDIDKFHKQPLYIPYLRLATAKGINGEEPGEDSLVFLMEMVMVFGG